jgi:hypothetical protein
MRRCKWKPRNLFCFWIVANAVIGHCFFSIREATSVAVIAGDMQAVTDVSEMAQELMNTCEGAMAIMGCADTGSGAHDRTSAAFEEASSQLEELGFECETPPGEGASGGSGRYTRCLTRGPNHPGRGCQGGVAGGGKYGK